MFLFNDFFDFVSLLNTNSKQPKKKKSKIEHVLYCDHCGKRIRYGEEVIQFKYNGVVFTFCKEDCKDKFVDNNIKSNFIHYKDDSSSAFRVKDYYYNSLGWEKELVPNTESQSDSLEESDKKDPRDNDKQSKEDDTKTLSTKDNFSDNITYNVIVNGSSNKENTKCSCSIVKNFSSKEEALDYYDNISFNELEFDIISKKLVKISGTSEEVLLSYK